MAESEKLGTREQILAAKLRENLKRRKLQARARRHADEQARAGESAGRDTDGKQG